MGFMRWEKWHYFVQRVVLIQPYIVSDYLLVTRFSSVSCINKLITLT